MEKLFDSLKKIITPEAISNMSSALDEDSGKVTSAVGAIIPSLFGAILEKGEDSHLEHILKQAGNSSSATNVSGISTGHLDSDTQKINTGFLDSLFGNKKEEFGALISSVSGLGKESTDKLIQIVSPLIAGFLGQKLNSGVNFKNILNQIHAEKDHLLSSIPSGLVSVLGISSLAVLGSSFINKAVNQTKETVESAKEKVQETYEEYKNKVEKKPGAGWIKWVILIVLIGLLIFWLLSKNSCSKNSEVTSDTNISGTDSLVQEEDTVTINDQSAPSTNRNLILVSLPSGTALKAYPGGIEDQVVKFLESSDYKNATNEELKDKWFDFDAINFEFGSGTKLTPESEVQGKNLVAILKEFPEAKIKIGAYTDKKGNEEANLKLSQERANTIKDLLVTNGMGDRVVGAEGYGSKFATVSATASDKERAKDRRISLRFEKN
ncbi:OmpA family protein [Apibacter sp. HY039]|uniref:OmpA family protein n=1 Tax=Apibacter sp. HY039 TaxID=2501476 RepID=UPI000FEB8B15|nr:OmpA family protein [Apibacter sp. HY039]